MNIRKIKFKDVFLLSDLYLSLSEENREYFHPFRFNKLYLILMFTFFALSNILGKPIQIILPKLFTISFVALTKDDIPIGFSYLHGLTKLHNGNLWEADDFGIVIIEQFQSLGVGSRLIENIIDVSVYNDIKRIKLTVLAKNRNAIDIYKKYGFKLGKYYNKRELWNGFYYKDYDMFLDL